MRPREIHALPHGATSVMRQWHSSSGTILPGLGAPDWYIFMSQTYGGRLLIYHIWPFYHICHLWTVTECLWVDPASSLSVSCSRNFATSASFCKGTMPSLLPPWEPRFGVLCLFETTLHTCGKLLFTHFIVFVALWMSIAMQLDLH